MHRLFLLRHATAGWAGPAMRDFDRPLTAAGRAEALAVGRVMLERGFMPDLVLCSPSERTRQTWDCVAAVLGTGGGNIRTTTSDVLYHGDAAGYLEAIVGASTASAVLVVGHNPMLAETAAAITGHGDKAALKAIAGFPQSGLAVFSFAEPLACLKRGSGTLEAFLLPGR